MAMALTLLRFILIIPFSACFFLPIPHAMVVALVIFLIACVTDFFDGYVARARNEVSVLGAALDPLADKLLIAAALLLMVHGNILTGINVIGALIILMREVMVTGLRESVIMQGGSLPVTKIAKWKTTFQMIAFVLFLATATNSGDALLSSGFQPLTNGLFWFAVMLTLWSGADYTFRAVSFLRKA